MTTRTKTLLNTITHSLEESKAHNVVTIQLPTNHPLTSAIVVTEGTSSRHVKAIANRLIDDTKKAQHRPLGVEGLEEAEWILIDLDDVIVHVMQPSIRAFYELEKIWQHVAEQNA